ncbi:hypothetical protein RRF57_007949 [Xylaria bambusicola]|uniref:Uncharacterized protein n=1 Tax=Xylaria bambusicola TaxID=326684 RepID=A0AAN7UGZ3_9PEZI
MAGGSESFLRADEAAVGLPKVGGGDLSRGEIGHRGASLEISWIAGVDFCGTGARSAVSVPDGGGKLGIVAAEICCLGVAEDARIFDRVLKGLKSWALFLRDWAGEVDARLDLPDALDSLVGDGSLD